MQLCFGLDRCEPDYPHGAVGLSLTECLCHSCRDRHHCYSETFYPGLGDVARISEAWGLSFCRLDAVSLAADIKDLFHEEFGGGNHELD